MELKDFTPEQLKRMDIQPTLQTAQPTEPKPSKYRNVKIQVDGITFDSKREAQYWAELKLREKAGDITALARQVPYDLRCPIDAWPPEREAVVSHYVADFRYCDKDGHVHVVDAKGKRTAMYLLKRKWLELQNGIVIEEV